MFWLVSLVYPRCAQTALQMFSVQKLDVGTFLRADYSILIRTTSGHFSRLYARYVPAGIFFMLLYAFGIPAFFAYLIFRVRKKFQVWRWPTRMCPCLWICWISARHWQIF